MNRQAGPRGFHSQCVCCEPAPAFAGPLVSRRNFLAGGTALGFAGATVAPPPASTQALAQAPRPRRIDVHHHIVPPVHAEALMRHKNTPAKWSVAMSLD